MTAQERALLIAVAKALRDVVRGKTDAAPRGRQDWARHVAALDAALRNLKEKP